MSFVPTILVVALGLAAVLRPAAAEDLKLGEALLARHCGSCHAVGSAGASPSHDAPALRTLGQRYPVDSLEEALGEGMMSGHPRYAGIQV